MRERYRRDPASVDASWRELFASERADEESGAAAAVAVVEPSAAVHGAAGAAELAQAIRTYGHLGARLDPLGLSPAPGDPHLDPRTHDLEPGELERLPASVVGGPIGLRARSANDAIEQLRRVYCQTTGYEFGHVFDPAE